MKNQEYIQKIQNKKPTSKLQNFSFHQLYKSLETKFSSWNCFIVYDEFSKSWVDFFDLINEPWIFSNNRWWDNWWISFEKSFCKSISPKAAQLNYLVGCIEFVFGEIKNCHQIRNTYLQYVITIGKVDPDPAEHIFDYFVKIRLVNSAFAYT